MTAQEPYCSSLLHRSSGHFSDRRLLGTIYWHIFSSIWSIIHKYSIISLFVFQYARETKLYLWQISNKTLSWFRWILIMGSAVHIRLYLHMREKALKIKHICFSTKLVVSPSYTLTWTQTLTGSAWLPPGGHPPTYSVIFPDPLAWGSPGTSLTLQMPN